MSDSKIPMPSAHSFVIQLPADILQGEFRAHGRVEHLTSGQATHFANPDELWHFVASLLAVLPDDSTT